MAEERTCEDNGHRHTRIKDKRQDRKEVWSGSKDHLKSLLGKESVLQTTINKKGVDMKGKFGRVLGDFIVDKKKVSKLLCEAGHAVPYFGGSKKDVEAKHMANRHKLVDAGIVEGPLE